MRNLEDLRVTDLRTELDKRDLEKTGVKVVLLERLKQALTDEGEDPENYDFDDDSEIKQENEGDYGGSHEVGEEYNGEDEEIGEEIDGDEEVEEGDIDEEEGEEEEGEEEEGVEGDEEEEGVETAEVGEKTNDIESSEETEDVKNTSDEVDSDKLIKSKSKTDDKDEDALDLMLDYNDQAFEEELCYEAESDEESSGKKKKLSTSKSSECSTAKKGSDNASKSRKPNNRLKSYGLPRGSSDVSPDKPATITDNNLWVSGIDKTVKAQDLKVYFNKIGKVAAVKIVMNAKSPGGKCFGFITMSKKEDAARCIEQLNQTQINGMTITVEKSPVKVKKDDGDEKKSGHKKDVYKKATEKRTSSTDKERKRRSPKPSQPIIHPRDIQSQKLFVGGLDPNTGTNTLRRFFSKFGPMTDVVVMRDPKTRCTRRFGFVTFEHLDDFKKALKARPHKIDDAVVDTKEATPRGMMELERSKEYTRSRNDRSRNRDRFKDRDQRGSRDEYRGRSYNQEDDYEKETISREHEELRREREHIERQKHELMMLERETIKRNRQDKQMQIMLEREKLEIEREELLHQQMSMGANPRYGGGAGAGAGGVKRPAEDNYYNDRKRGHYDDQQSQRWGGNNRQDNWNAGSNRQDTWKTGNNRQDSWAAGNNRQDSWAAGTNRQDSWTAAAGNDRQDSWAAAGSNRQDSWTAANSREDSWTASNNRQDSWTSGNNAQDSWKGSSRQDTWGGNQVDTSNETYQNNTYNQGYNEQYSNSNASAAPSQSITAGSTWKTGDSHVASRGGRSSVNMPQQYY